MNDTSPLPPTATLDKLRPLDFRLPPELEANAPPEARGLRRDDIRLMISRISDDSISHARFGDLATVLEEGDLLLINTSGTMNAALPARRGDGTPLELGQMDLACVAEVLEDDPSQGCLPR